MAVLDLDKFKTLFPSCSINEAFLAWEAERLEGILRNQIGDIFSLQIIGDAEGATAPYIDFEGKNTEYRKIGVWQETGLVVKLGQYDNSVLQTLVLNQDYVLERYNDSKHPSLQRPIVGVRMLKGTGRVLTNNYGYEPIPLLSDSTFLRITGTLGWQEGYPDEIVHAFYQILLNNVSYNQSMMESRGKGIITEEDDLSSSVKIATNSEILSSQRRLAFNPLEDEYIKGLIKHYRSYATSTQTKLTR